MKYVVYDPSSGEITVSGECDVPDDHGLGLLLENVVGSNATHYVSGGQLMAYTQAQVATKAAVPPFSALWSNTIFEWIDQRSLEQAKADKRAELRVARTAAIYSTFTWDGSEFDANVESQGLIKGAVLDAMVASQAGADFSIDWTLADNSVRTLSGSDVIQMGLAMSALIKTNFSKSQALQAALEASTSIEQLESITW
jgi:hypothetical protein